MQKHLLTAKHQRDVHAVFIGCAYGVHLLTAKHQRDVHAVFIGCAYGVHLLTAKHQRDVVGCEVLNFYTSM